MDDDRVYVWEERLAARPDFHECSSGGYFFTEPAEAPRKNVGGMTKRQVLAHAEEHYGIDLEQYIEHIPGKNYTHRLYRAVHMLRDLSQKLVAENVDDLDRTLQLRLALAQYRKQTA